MWLETTEVEFTNWEVQDTNLSMLSANTCFWIQSNTGLWKPGSCKNRTHGVICKRPRSKAPFPPQHQLYTSHAALLGGREEIQTSSEPIFTLLFLAGAETSAVTCKYQPLLPRSSCTGMRHTARGLLRLHLVI